MEPTETVIASREPQTDRAGAEPRASGEVAAAKVVLPYEPPKLVRVGSLRALLGKTGFVADKGPPFELRE